MFNESAQIVLTESTQIVWNVGYVLALIGVIWKVATDHTKTKNSIKKLEEEKQEHKETHEEIKCQMNQYNGSIQELRFDLHTNNMQFKSVEAKLEGIQTSIVLLQSQYAKSQEHQNEVTKELINTIKNMDIERRKS